MSLLLCIIAFVMTLYLSRRSVVWGIASALAFGYFYGILRANLNEMMAHFIFDGAVIGLYLGRVLASRRSDGVVNTELLRPWMIVLIAWPAFLTVLPIQDPLVQIVGFRSSTFLIPFVLLGSLLRPDERRELALFLAVLNLTVFFFASAQFIFGVEAFFPRNNVTELIYRSSVDSAQSYLRIPATFTSSAAFGGAMVCSIPLLVEAWFSTSSSDRKRYIVLGSLVASTLGVFMSASRTQAVVLLIIVGVGMLSLSMRPAKAAVWLLIILGVGWIVLQDTRLQRFSTLGDTDLVAERISGSVNASFLTALADYPMGNGIGAGGTSIPYFLSDRVRGSVSIENEYARIQLELGFPGLAMWMAFILWTLAIGFTRVRRASGPARRMAYALVVTGWVFAVLGTGLLTGIPGSAVFLLLCGWVVRVEDEVGAANVTSRKPAMTEGRVALRARIL